MKWLLVVAMVIGALLSPCYASVDDMAFKGTPLKDREMDEVRGGFSLPNGNFVYFSMDFMRVKYISQTGPANPGSKSNGWMNVLNQQALITDKGISFNMQVAQAGEGNGGENGNTPATQASPNNASGNTPISSPAGGNNGNTLIAQPVTGNTGIATASFINSSGISNANLNTGTGNVTQSIANIININVGIFNVVNASQTLPMLRNWLRF